MQADLAGRFAADRIAPEAVSYARQGDLRYLGQGYELKVDLPPGALDEAAMTEVFAAFHAAHRREYGHAFPGNPVEIVTLRVTGRGAMPGLPPAPPPDGSGDTAGRTVESLFRVAGTLQAQPTAVRARQGLSVGAVVPGPAILVQPDTTVLVPPAWQAVAEADGSLRMTRKEV